MPHESRVGVNTPYQTSQQGQTSIDGRLTQAIIHWQFGSQEWRQFLEFDKAQRQKHDTKAAFAILIIFALGLVVFLFLGLLGNSEEALPAIGALLIFAAIVALGVIAHFLIQGRKYQRMDPTGTGDGDIFITPKGIRANGVWFHWGEGTAWRLTTVTPVLADTGVRLPPGVLSYIEFKCRARAAGRYRMRVDKKWRVPVPPGKEDEAREIIRYFGKPSTLRDKFGVPAD